MVARGDLGVEIGAAEVPLLQKRIIVHALERGKPVITATQMLESMIHSPEPTRAEASRRRQRDPRRHLRRDAVGRDGGRRVLRSRPSQTMDRIALAVEPSLDYRHETPQASDEPTIGQAMSNAACDVAEALAAKAILVPTFTGRTASAVARLRPRRPILALHAPDGVAPPHGARVGRDAARHPGDHRRRGPLDALASRPRAESGIVVPGDRVVITAGTAVNIPGATNVIKVDAA